MLKSITLALAGAALLIAGTASAQESDSRTVGITYQDLDLATEAGRAELERRINTAARRACGMNDRATGSHIVTREARDCYRTAKRELDRQFAQVISDRNRAG